LTINESRNGFNWADARLGIRSTAVNLSAKSLPILANQILANHWMFHYRWHTQRWSRQGDAPL
jgi:hypothetical protein